MALLNTVYSDGFSLVASVAPLSQAELQDAAIVADTSTFLSLDMPQIDYRFDVYGTGLGYDNDGVPISGTISSITAFEGGVAAYTITGLQTSVAAVHDWVFNEPFGPAANPLFLDNDTMTGGSGKDLLSGYGGNNVLYGGPGDDTLVGGDGNDHLYGQSPNGGPDGADSILAGGGSDYLQGNAGNDTLEGGGGSDRINGGAGNDYIGGDASPLSSYDNDPKAGNYTINGNLGDDDIYGDGGNDSLRGGQGDDRIFGGPGNDVLLGDKGDDTLAGGTGLDILTGGDGSDLFQFHDLLSPSPDTGFVASGPDASAIDVVTDFQIGVDRLAIDYVGVAATTASDLAGAVAAAQQIFSARIPPGSQVVDTVAVSVGPNTFVFEGGPAQPISGALELLNVSAVDLRNSTTGNPVNGTAGNDTLFATAPADIITGFGGADHFIFEQGTAAPTAVSFAIQDGLQMLTDTVRDYADGTDKIYLAGGVGSSPGDVLQVQANDFASAFVAAQAALNQHVGTHDVAVYGDTSAGTYRTYLFYSDNAGTSINSIIRLFQVDPHNIDSNDFLSTLG